MVKFKAAEPFVLQGHRIKKDDKIWVSEKVIIIETESGKKMTPMVFSLYADGIKKIFSEHVKKDCFRVIKSHCVEFL